ncbi:hypothetical protein [Halanaeroarchaeum sp. HSR-CO]|uniref:hypothetical protein n=1 Tax=Halanaeroarchaeum sp. HSR-CO TaxID=2866382 RepID=UPI00217D3F3D|nr:hypothetical protein [Halanaeroarchaeum sp. HSR-CO]
MAQAQSAEREVMYAHHRDLRDLGHDDPGLSLPRRTMRDLGLLDEQGVADHQVFVTIYSDGRVILDLQVDR